MIDPDSVAFDIDGVVADTMSLFLEHKAEILLKRNIEFFIEDRLDTCDLLYDAGVLPILYKQPWNREPHSYREVSSWDELETLIDL